jgi:hypothetical protein
VTKQNGNATDPTIHPAQTIATHGVVNVATLDVRNGKAGGGGNMWVGTSGAMANMATSDEVAIREAETQVG